MNVLKQEQKCRNAKQETVQGYLVVDGGKKINKWRKLEEMAGKLLNTSTTHSNQKNHKYRKPDKTTKTE